MGVSLSALSLLSLPSLLPLCLFRPLPAPLLSGVGLGVGQSDKAPTYILKGYTMLMTKNEASEQAYNDWLYCANLNHNTNWRTHFDCGTPFEIQLRAKDIEDDFYDFDHVIS